MNDDVTKLTLMGGPPEGAVAETVWLLAEVVGTPEEKSDSLYSEGSRLT